MNSEHNDAVRWCKRCHQFKPKERFLAWTTCGGAVQHRGHCLDCRETYAEERAAELIAYRQQYNAGKRSLKRERDRQRREEVKAAVDKLKDVPCADCGNRFPPVAMDFDHIGPKMKSIATMVSQAYRLELIIEEIKKCEKVCACCHRIRTAKRKDNHAPCATPPATVRATTIVTIDSILALFTSDEAAVISVAEIASRTNRDYHQVAKTLRRLAKDGRLLNPHFGYYRLPARRAA